MKNSILGGLLAAFFLFSACVGDSKPKVGDAVFYDYEVENCGHRCLFTNLGSKLLLIRRLFLHNNIKQGN